MQPSERHGTLKDRTPMSAGSEDEVVRSLVGRLIPADLGRTRTALVIIDLQVLDAAADGEHAQRARQQGRWSEVEEYFARVAELVAPNVRRLAEAMRARSEPVIYVRCRSLSPDARDNGRRFREFGIAVGCDDPQAAILPELGVLPGDYVLDKTTASPFWSTAIERLLGQLAVENLIVTGVVTSGCVESTVRDACDLDYCVVLVEDACADRQPQLHADAVRRLNNNFAVALSTDAVLEMVGAGTLERSIP
jgi:nicotinamidase-related amidase